VQVAGVDAWNLSAEHRGTRVAFVSQRPHFLSATVADNLTHTAHEADIEAVLALVGLDGTLSPSTPLSGAGGGPGVLLSTGQGQLLAVARGLIHNPSVLVLDEATDSLDDAADATLRADLRRHCRTEGVALLTVAHRLSTALDADLVIVVADGRIVEEGPPHQLQATGGWLAHLMALHATQNSTRDQPVPNP
jgi:ATP-binding cassette subfamily B protein